MQNPEVFYTAIARLENGQLPQQVADELGVSYSTVLRWRKEYESAKQNNVLDQLLDMDKLILASAVANIEAPLELKEKALEDFGKKLDNLSLLRENTQSCAMYLVQQIKSHASRVEHISELSELTTSLCAIQNAFFNQNKTQVNIQNNLGAPGESKYSSFLSDVPVEGN